MNDGFLLEDCVIDNLMEIGIIYKNSWEHHIKESYYHATYYTTGEHPSLISVEINIINGIRVIPKSNIRILEKKFKKDLSIIFEKCNINTFNF